MPHRIEPRAPESLRPNPHRDILPRLDDERRALTKEEMQQGRTDPINITPDGTIIDGHTRVDIAKELGWPEIPVSVVEGLAKEDLCETYLARNLRGRQLSNFDRVRIFVAYLKSAGRAKSGDGETRERIAKLVGLGSGRNADRLAKLLELPPQIQTAIEQGSATQKSGHEFLKFPRDLQEQVLLEIGYGKDVEQAIRDANGYRLDSPNRELASVGSDSIEEAPGAVDVLPQEQGPPDPTSTRHDVTMAAEDGGPEAADPRSPRTAQGKRGHSRESAPPGSIAEVMRLAKRVIEYINGHSDIAVVDRVDDARQIELLVERLVEFARCVRCGRFGE